MKTRILSAFARFDRVMWHTTRLNWACAAAIILSTLAIAIDAALRR
jgi:hypothetical protein